jgi:hypothetical protein
MLITPLAAFNNQRKTLFKKKRRTDAEEFPGQNGYNLCSFDR